MILVCPRCGTELRTPTSGLLAVCWRCERTVLAEVMEEDEYEHR